MKIGIIDGVTMETEKRIGALNGGRTEPAAAASATVNFPREGAARKLVNKLAPHIRKRNP